LSEEVRRGPDLCGYALQGVGSPTMLLEILFDAENCILDKWPSAL